MIVGGGQMNRNQWLILGIVVVVATGIFVVTVNLGKSSPSISSTAIEPENIGGAIGAISTDQGAFFGVDTLGKAFRIGDVVQSIFQLPAQPYAAAWSAKGKFVAVLPRDNSGSWHILQLSDGKEIYQLSPSIQALTWSPDGTRIAYEYADGQNHNLSIADPDGKNWIKIVDLTVSVRQLAWLPDKTHMLFIDSQNRLQLVNISSRTTKLVAEEVVHFEVSPDGNKILTAKSSITAQLKYGVTDLSNLNQDVFGPEQVIPFENSYPFEVIWGENSNAILGVDRSSGVQIVQYALQANQRSIVAESKKILKLNDITMLLFQQNKILYFSTTDSAYKLTLVE